MQYNTERIVNFAAKLPNGIAPNSRMLGINYCMEGNYKHRVVDALLERKLLGKGAVLVEGAKWCGKTTTSSRLAKSILKLGETSVLRSSRQLAEMNPALLLRGETPRLIDEWQTIPILWDYGCEGFACVRRPVGRRVVSL